MLHFDIQIGSFSSIFFPFVTHDVSAQNSPTYPPIPLLRDVEQTLEKKNRGKETNTLNEREKDSLKEGNISRKEGEKASVLGFSSLR